MRRWSDGLGPRRLTAVVLAGLLLAAVPAAAADDKETPPADLEALERSVGELEVLGQMYGVYLEAMQRLFDCVPEYSWPNFMDRVVTLPPEEVVEYLGRIDFDPLEFDVVARHCLFPSRSLAVRLDDRGQYVFAGKINGVRVQFLVDTGANAVAVSSLDAARAGLVRDEMVKVNTGGGWTVSYKTVIDRLEVRPRLVLKGVKARINPKLRLFGKGEEGGGAVFGTPSLGRSVDMRTVGSTLFLQAKRLDTGMARRVSQTVRALLVAFHVMQNECGAPLPDKEEAKRCLSADLETGQVPDEEAEVLREKYAPIIEALQLG